MNTQPAISEETIQVWDGRITMRVKVAGAGSPLLYLHPAAGLAWDPFLSHLAERYTVYAPEFPGTSLGDPYAVHQVDDLTDVVLLYEELVRKLGLVTPVVVGQSFGGMLACELAAHFPDLVWAFGCTGKFTWPIPDRGLRDRLHRISTRTLIIWGREDKLAHVAYAGEFATGIAGSKVARIDDCGHIPQVERYDQTVHAVDE